MIDQDIDAVIHNLPSYLKREVLNYIQLLANNYRNRNTTTPQKKFKFDWEGGLADVEGKITSVQLQHKAMDWR